MITLPELLSRSVSDRGLQFQFGGEKISSMEVFSPRSFMPLIVLSASARAQELLNIDLGLAVEPSGDALLGVKAVLPVTAGSDALGVLQMVFLDYAAEQVFNLTGLSPGSVVDCTPLYEEYSRLRPSSEGSVWSPQ